LDIAKLYLTFISSNFNLCQLRTIFNNAWNHSCKLPYFRWFANNCYLLTTVISDSLQTSAIFKDLQTSTIFYALQILAISNNGVEVDFSRKNQSHWNREVANLNRTV